MGSFGVWGPVCEQCRGNRAVYVADGVGPLCNVCISMHCNLVQAEALPRMLPQLAEVPGICLLIVEMLSGDGWEDVCPCRGCSRHWFPRGWVCPAKLAAGGGL